MASRNIWKRRLKRWRNAGNRWVSLRKKDLAWLRARHSFQQKLPELLHQHEWVFLVGCNNSGTTLIHDVLAATGRFSFMPHEGQVYTNAIRLAEKRGHERVWTEYLDELRLDEAQSTDAAARLVFDWLREMEPLKDKVLEKTPANAVRMLWLQRAFPRSAFIGIVRDGYAVVEGIKRKGHKPVGQGARHWQQVNEIMLEDAKRVDRFLLLRYEDFVGSPNETLPRVAQFLGLPNDELQAAFEHINQNPTEASVEPVHDMNLRSLQRLSRDEVQTIAREAGELLSRLGYVH